MKRIISYIIVFVLGISVTVGATLISKASDVKFKPSNIEWNVDNVEDAINELYDKANEYNINYDLDGGTTTNTSKVVKYNDIIGELPIPTKENYEFIGWYYNNQLINENTIYDFNENITLEAKYEQKKFKLIIGLVCGYWTTVYPNLQYIITADGYTIYTLYGENAKRYIYLSPGTKVTLKIANGNNVNYYKSSSWSSADFIKSTNIISFYMPAQNVYFNDANGNGAINQYICFYDEEVKNKIDIPITYGS